MGTGFEKITWTLAGEILREFFFHAEWELTMAMGRISNWEWKAIKKAPFLKGWME